MGKTEVELRWENLVRYVNSAPPLFGQVGVRDPEHPCESFDAEGYNGRGECMSDGHYMCTECSLLSPDAYRFTEFGADGRRDRLLLFWRRKR